MRRQPFVSRRGAAGRQVKVGQRVRVRSAREILATLDADGAVDGLPFMPEMLKFCGQTATVSGVAHKTCDTVTWTGLRRMRDAVHLSGLRCDGSAHGGCQAGCLLFWKTDWLELIGDVAGAGDGGEGSAEQSAATELSAQEEARLRAACRQPGAGDGETRWRCQATQLLEATEPLPWWDARQYVADLASGNVGWRTMVTGLTVLLFNKYQGLSKRVLPRRLRIRGGAWYPFMAGPLEKTPRQQTGLQPGDTVRVKSRERIFETLDRGGRNRGLTFDGEMLRYCNTDAKVLRRVERIIDESSGKMVSIPGDCVVLDGVTCTARYHLFCPRSTYPYWREIWLDRAEASTAAEASSGDAG